MDDEEKRIRKNEYGKRWYQKNKKKIKENRSKYYQENKEKYKEYCKEYGKKYRQKNKEKLKEYWKEYGKEYRQKNRNRNREWGEIAQIALLHMMPCCTWRTYNERELDEELERIMGLTLPNTNMTVRSLTEDNPLSVSAYVGYTSQTGDNEFYASFSRPHSVLKMAGCGWGKKKLMELGFQPMVLGSYTCRPRARQVEGALHRLMEHLPLGERLWRRTDGGAKGYDGKWQHRVFIIFFTTGLLK